MLEWLNQMVLSESLLTQEQISIRLIMAVIYGGCVAAVYRFSHGRSKDDAAILTATLMLLSVLIAMVSMVIGDSVARAFSLVGALSIVRFRTVVEDTRDTAFVIFAVIVGMAAGAGLMLVPLFGIPLVAAVAVLLSRGRFGPGEGKAAGVDQDSTSTAESDAEENLLTVRLGLGREPELLFAAAFERHLSRHSLKSVETARQGSALDLTYQLRLRNPLAMAALVAELNQVDGVQSVSLRTRT